LRVFLLFFLHPYCSTGFAFCQEEILLSFCYKGGVVVTRAAEGVTFSLSREHSYFFRLLSPLEQLYITTFLERSQHLSLDVKHLSKITRYAG